MTRCFCIRHICLSAVHLGIATPRLASPVISDRILLMLVIFSDDTYTIHRFFDFASRYVVFFVCHLPSCAAQWGNTKTCALTHVYAPSPPMTLINSSSSPDHFSLYSLDKKRNFILEI